MSEQIKDGGPRDVLEELAHWCNENGIGRDKYTRRSATYAAVADLIDKARKALDEMYHAEASVERFTQFQDAYGELETALAKFGSES